MWKRVLRDNFFFLQNNIVSILRYINISHNKKIYANNPRKFYDLEVWLVGACLQIGS